MIVPQFWAEARVKDRIKGKQVTLRRFGWSDASAEDAQVNADARVRDALARLLAGEKIEKREPKIPYNGAQGVPIREEIVSREGDAIVTRNGYGALCVNTPDVLFADIDFEAETPGKWIFSVMGVMIVAAIAAWFATRSKGLAIAMAVLALFFSFGIASALHRLVRRGRKGPEAKARERIDRFVREHPEWHLRVYRTPAGLRLLAMHRTFDPQEPAVVECFRELDVDPVYVRMCRNQHCFRARVTPKPWRIGIGSHMKPRPGVWPVNPARLGERRQWIDAYELTAQKFAACRFIEAKGSTAVDPRARAVQALHDELCRANTSLPLA
jgi:hypothetical protein